MYISTRIKYTRRIQRGLPTNYDEMRPLYIFSSIISFKKYRWKKAIVNVDIVWHVETPDGKIFLIYSDGDGSVSTLASTVERRFLIFFAFRPEAHEYE